MRTRRYSAGAHGVWFSIAACLAVSCGSSDATLPGEAGSAGKAGSVSATGGTDTGGLAPSAGGAPSGAAPATGGLSAGGTGTGGLAPSIGGAPGGGVPAAGGLSGGDTGTGGSAPTTGGTPSGGASATGGGLSSGGTSTGGSTSAGGSTSGPGCGNPSLPAACDTESTGPCTLDVDGTNREYFVVLPTSYDADTPYPLVFVWHGLNGMAQQLLAGGFMGGSGGFYGVRTNMPEAVYVVPQGLPSGMDDSGTDYGWPDTNGRDIAFLKAMISWLESNYCIDQNRLFSTGMSFGGMMSDRIGCQMPDVFRALGVMSGSLWAGQGCMDLPIAAWITHGTDDSVVAISGGEDARDQFVQQNGCDTTNTTTETLDANTTCTIYNVCTTGNYPVVWCPVNGEGHTIPSWAGAEIAKFFLQF